MPAGPCTMTSRASAAVGATSAMYRALPLLTRSWIHCAPVRVLPKNLHRAYFLPIDEGGAVEQARPSGRIALASLGMLFVALLSVVLLAKGLAPALEAGVQAGGTPLAIVGVIIAAIVLLPETAAAIRAAARRQLQAPPDRPALPLCARDEELKGCAKDHNQIDRARVLEVRIHSSPAASLRTFST
jgi:hypothetical protein